MIYKVEKDGVGFYTSVDKIADYASRGYKVLQVQELTSDEIAAAAETYSITGEGQVTEEVTVNG